MLRCTMISPTRSCAKAMVFFHPLQTPNAKKNAAAGQSGAAFFPSATAQLWVPSNCGFSELSTGLSPIQMRSKAL